MTASEHKPTVPTERRLRMLALQATPAPTTAGQTTAYDARSAAMSRVPIATLLRSDAVERVERLTLHGRTYWSFRNELYLFPADDDEFERLDIMHKLIYDTALNNQLHLAALSGSGGRGRILDVGFGTGFWMQEVSQLYKDAEIIGFDINNPIGRETHNNSVFKSPVDFTAPQWPIEDGSVDLVHMAQLAGSVPSWLDIYRKAHKCLRPGIGHLEHIEIDWTPRSSQRDFPPEARPISLWWEYMVRASTEAGKPMAYREDTEDLLEQAGFIDSSHKRIRIPFYYRGIQDPQQHILARDYQMAMGYEGTRSFTGFSMALFTRYFRWTPEQVEHFCADVVSVVQNDERNLPLYMNLHVWTARRPQS